MTTKKTPSDQDPETIKSEPEPDAVHNRNKRRKHGYRGYPNNPSFGGDIHMGSGFAGVGTTGGAGSSGSGIISDKTRQSVETNEDDEEE